MDLACLFFLHVINILSYSTENTSIILKAVFIAQQMCAYSNCSWKPEYLISSCLQLDFFKQMGRWGNIKGCQETICWQWASSCVITYWKYCSELIAIMWYCLLFIVSWSHLWYSYPHWSDRCVVWYKWGSFLFLLFKAR